MWSYESNPINLIDNFSSAVDVDVPSRGGWSEDFTAVCSKYKILAPCPYIKAVTSGSGPDMQQRIRIINAMIDLSSWRAMLLAACCVGSKVKEISVHNCHIEPVFLQDLATALRKLGTCPILRLNYMQMDLSKSYTEFQSAFVELLSDLTCLEHLSLKGNRLSDDFVAPLISALTENNFKLATLNLSTNDLTDVAAAQLLRSLRFSTSLKRVSLSANLLDGSCLSALSSLLIGTDVSAEDEAKLKLIGKQVADKNKAIKELNKKRKKSGAPDVIEVVPSHDCCVKRDGKVVAINRSLAALDLSRNPLLDFQTFQLFSQSIASLPTNESPLPPAALISTDNHINKLTMLLRGHSQSLADYEVDLSPQQWLLISSS